MYVCACDATSLLQYTHIQSNTHREEQTKLSANVVGGKEAKDAKTIVDGDDDNVLGVGHQRAVVQGNTSAALLKATTVDEEHHGQQRGIGRGIDVQVQAVLARGGGTARVRVQMTDVDMKK